MATSLVQTTVVTNQSEAIPRYGATTAQLDLLELVRSGALPAYPLGSAPGSVRLPLPQATGVSPDDVVQITDLEGVPVAQVMIANSPDGPVTQGTPTWLSIRSSRPFERWHVGPDHTTEITGAVVLRGPAPPQEADAALAAAGSRPLLLALASLDGDGDPTALETARQLQTLADRHPGVLIAVAPAPATLDARERDAVVRAYVHGQATTLLGGAPPSHKLAETGTVLFFTGLSGSGKSTLARAVRNQLVEAGERVTLLDGDVVRRHLSSGLGFSAADRDTNIRRIGWVAAEIAHHGGVAICSPIAPFEQTRRAVREMAEARGARFVLVHVATPLSECERRDRKGLYARARRGEIPDFTGISSPYQTPDSPELRVDTIGREVDDLVCEVLALLDESPAC